MYKYNTNYNTENINKIFEQNQYFYDYARHCGFLNGFNMAVYQKNYELGYNYAKTYYNEPYHVPKFFQNKHVPTNINQNVNTTNSTTNVAGEQFNKNNDKNNDNNNNNTHNEVAHNVMDEIVENVVNNYEDLCNSDSETESEHENNGIKSANTKNTPSLSSSYSDDFIEESIVFTSEEDFKFSPLNKTIQNKKKLNLFNLDSSYSSFDSDIEPPLPPPPTKPITIRNDKILPLRSLPKLPSPVNKSTSKKTFFWEDSDDDDQF